MTQTPRLALASLALAAAALIASEADSQMPNREETKSSQFVAESPRVPSLYLASYSFAEEVRALPALYCLANPQAVQCNVNNPPLRCSAEYLQPLSPTVTLFHSVFWPACVRHDFCYRHGKVTYNYTRTHCDNTFESEMRHICNNPSPQNLILIPLSGGAFLAQCNLAATAYASAVRNFGASSYNTATTCCEYDGPATTAGCTGYPWSSAGTPGPGWFVGDFDGDGKSDVLRYMNPYGGADVMLSTGGKFNPAGNWSGAGTNGRPWVVADFNGDGKDDVARYTNAHGGADVFFSTGTTFQHQSVWSNAGTSGHRWYSGDFDGDGKGDLFRYINPNGGAEVFLSGGSGLQGGGTWTTAGTRGHRWYVGDFNGDGRDDIMRYLNPSGGAEVLLSTGSAFAAPQTWSTAGTRGHRWYVGDFNGDKKADLLRYMNQYGGAEVFFSDGTKFEGPYLWSTAGTRGRGWWIGDFNGDGRADIMRFMNQYGGAQVLLADTSSFVYARAH